MNTNLTNVTPNFDALDTPSVSLDFDALDTATRGTVKLILNTVSQRATQTGKQRLYFEFANESGQVVSIGIWADRANEFFVMLRRTLELKEKGNELIKVLTENFYTYIVRNDENGYPYIDFMAMKGE